MTFREINLSLLLCSRCVYDACPHLKHAPSRIWDGLFFLFSDYLNPQLMRRGLQKVKAFREINLSLLLCSCCVYDACSHLKHAPKPHLGGIIFPTQKSWLHLAPKNRKPETWYSIKYDVGTNKNAGQAFSMPRLSSHFMLYQVSGFRFFSPSNQDSPIRSL